MTEELDGVEQDRIWQETKREMRQQEWLAYEKDLTERVANVYKGQNRLLRQVAKELDAQFPPDEDWDFRIGHTSPGDVVRQFIIEAPKEAAKEAVNKQKEDVDGNESSGETGGRREAPAPGA